LSRLLDLYPSLRVPSFRLLWLGMLPANIAFQMSQVAVGYAAFGLTGSAAALGIVSLASGLPQLLLGLVGGVAADRMSRRAVLLGTQSTLAVVALVQAVLALTGSLQVWHLGVTALFQGCAFAFNMPARQALIGDLVGPKLLRNAVALNNAGMNFNRIAGPSLAGMLLAMPFVGVGGVFSVMTGLYGLVTASLLRLPPAADAVPSSAGQRKGGWEELLEGLRYVRASPVLLALLGLALIPVIVGMPFQTLMPVFAERVYHVGAAGLGSMMAAVGVGALFGAVGVATMSGYSRPAVVQLCLGVGFGISLSGFALAPTYPIALIMLVLVGGTSAAYQALNNTLIMGNTEPRLYGRVMSVYMLTFAAMPLGSFPASWIADHVGGRATVAGGGIIVALSVLTVALVYRPYSRIK
ncbi:MAG TPA: MFS transporter, partial [Chloroflexota bacterium]|nr:MFS transporter [Chloroflexota bacterium]